MPKGRPRGAVGKSRRVRASELREILKPIYKKLEKAGVSDAAMPRPDAIVERLLGWIDEEKVKEWIENYAAAMGK